MKHFIITRFHYSRDFEKTVKETATNFLSRSEMSAKEYVQHRLQLFDQFTKPSILAQTCQDFEWLILGNPTVHDTGAKFFGEKCSAPLPTTMTNAYLDYIKEVTKDDDLVLMTRLDNDDILMPTYIEDMQERATKPGLYEFLGYRYDLRNGKFFEDTVHHKECTSPFTTLARFPGSLKTVYYCNHSRMWQRFPLTIIKKRNWVQIIHSSNWVLNKCSPVTTEGKGIEIEIHPFVKRLTHKSLAIRPVEGV